MRAWQRLKHRSYSIALDNFAPNDLRESLVALADFVKIDISRVSQEQSAAIAAKYASKCRMLAQKVETRIQTDHGGNRWLHAVSGIFFPPS
jgi:c-di-GMP-related signal transduction protein